MAMTSCTECSGVVSTTAAACPHCGAPVDRMAALVSTPGEKGGGLSPEERAAVEKSVDRNLKGGCLVLLLLVGGCTAYAATSDSSSGADDAGSSAGARGVCEQFVEDRLRAPATADFSGATATGAGDTWTVRGQVDSENGFGAQLRSAYTCQVLFTGDGNYRLLSLQLD